MTDKEFNVFNEYAARCYLSPQEGFFQSFETKVYRSVLLKNYSLWIVYIKFSLNFKFLGGHALIF